MPEKLWTEICDIVQEAVIKTIPKKKKCRKQNACLRRPCKQLRKKKKRERERSKRQRTKRKIYPSECRVPKKSKER